MKKSISVIGQGFVGGSITTVFAERGFDVFVYDKAGKVAPGGKRLFLYDTKELSSVTDLVSVCEQKNDFSKIYFVCLPTPMHEDGSADLSIVDGVLTELASIPGERIAVVKSTVPPGSVETWNQRFANTGLRIVFNPEFLREATALDDMRNQDRIILGGPRPWINTVKMLYESAYPNVPIIKTSSTTAEMVKYVTNIHLAVKVSLANEFYQICDALDKQGKNIDYDKVIEYATLDKRLGSSHWKVPGPMPDDITGQPAFGFAGSCVLPDTTVLMANWQKVRIGDFVRTTLTSFDVKSVDHTCSIVENRELKEVTRRYYDGEVFTFNVDDRSITSTAEHFFPMLRAGKVTILQAKDILETDQLFVLKFEDTGEISLGAKTIDSITRSHYEGDVYNLHLKSERGDDQDDLFWVGNGIVTHNCFIKDLNALMALSKDLGIEPKTMQGAWEKNLEVRPQRDWERLVGRAISEKPKK